MPHRFDPDAFGFLVTDLARMIRADMDRRIESAGIGITPGEARALVYAARFGEVRQSVLAERMGLEAMTVSGYLDRLEHRGFVKRAPDPGDRRAKLVRLTDKADAALEAIARMGAEVRARARGDMSDEEWTALLSLLKASRQRFCRS